MTPYFYPANAPTNARLAFPTPLPTHMATPLPMPTNAPANVLCPNPPYPPERWKRRSRAHSTRLPTYASLGLARSKPFRPNLGRLENDCEQKGTFGERMS